MRSTRFFVAIFLCHCAFADLPSMPSLTLKNGKSYAGVTVTKKRDDGISIVHESGTAQIPFEQIPDDLVETLGGFDESKAKQARAAASAREQQHHAAMDAFSREKKEGKVHAAKAEAASAAILEIVQSLDGGALCKVAWLGVEDQTVTRKDSFGRDVKTTRKVPSIPRFQDAWIYVPRLAGADGERLAAGLCITNELFTYQSTSGAQRTLRICALATKPQPTATVPLPSLTTSPAPYIPQPTSRMQRIGGG